MIERAMTGWIRRWSVSLQAGKLFGFLITWHPPFSYRKPALYIVLWLCWVELRLRLGVMDQ